jgi:hypothetical protein
MLRKLLIDKMTVAPVRDDSGQWYRSRSVPLEAPEFHRELDDLVAAEDRDAQVVAWSEHPERLDDRGAVGGAGQRETQDREQDVAADDDLLARHEADRGRLP